MDQVFNLIMEQDAAFFDRMKTGSRTQPPCCYILRSRSAILMRCC